MTAAGAEHLINITFNVESDAGGGDPDRTSPTLRRYHQLLWSKPLADGTRFTLDATTPYSYLHHASAVGEFFLSSDSIVHSYRGTYMNRLGAVMSRFRLSTQLKFMMRARPSAVTSCSPGTCVIASQRSMGPAGCIPRSATAST